MRVRPNGGITVMLRLFIPDLLERTFVFEVVQKSTVLRARTERSKSQTLMEVNKNNWARNRNLSEC